MQRNSSRYKLNKGTCVWIVENFHYLIKVNIDKSISQQPIPHIIEKQKETSTAAFVTLPVNHELYCVLRLQVAVCVSVSWYRIHAALWTGGGRFFFTRTYGTIVDCCSRVDSRRRAHVLRCTAAVLIESCCTPTGLTFLLGHNRSISDHAAGVIYLSRARYLDVSQSRSLHACIRVSYCRIDKYTSSAPCSRITSFQECT